mmetsp:Transcript_102756/g.261046  ORF Transcript_102756/g.261046 Transcript_102756/m.261046 type:complete len:212 (-) Transcript_102756:104-739(-)
MAMLCPVGVMAPSLNCRAPAEYCRDIAAFVEASEHNDERSFVEEEVNKPLLGEGSPRASEMMREEHRRMACQAQDIIQQKMKFLSGRRGDLNRTETSELLRDTCQAIEDLATGLEERWLQANPGQPMPSWPLTRIPEDELARIGWDFHANRVQMLNTGGSVWETIAMLLSGDQQASFAKPPSCAAVASALNRAAARLRDEIREGSEVDGAL